MFLDFVTGEIIGTRPFYFNIDNFCYDEHAHKQLEGEKPRCVNGDGPGCPTLCLFQWVSSIFFFFSPYTVNYTSQPQEPHVTPNQQHSSSLHESYNTTILPPIHSFDLSQIFMTVSSKERTTHLQQIDVKSLWNTRQSCFKP